jgi:hypothetical protein
MTSSCSLYVYPPSRCLATVRQTRFRGNECTRSNRRFVGRDVLYAVCIVSNESRRLVLPNSSRRRGGPIFKHKWSGKEKIRSCVSTGREAKNDCWQWPPTISCFAMLRYVGSSQNLLFQIVIPYNQIIRLTKSVLTTCILLYIYISICRRYDPFCFTTRELCYYVFLALFVGSMPIRSSK